MLLCLNVLNDATSAMITFCIVLLIKDGHIFNSTTLTIYALLALNYELGTTIFWDELKITNVSMPYCHKPRNVGNLRT